MSHAASAVHTTPTFANKGHSNIAPCSVPRRRIFQRKPFVGDRVEHRRSPQPRALYRSHTVCITRVDEAEFQAEVLKVGIYRSKVHTAEAMRSQTSLGACQPEFFTLYSASE